MSFAYYAVTPFLTSRISGLDADGSLLSRSIVITFAAAFIGTALAGTMLTQLGGLGCGPGAGRLCAAGDAVRLEGVRASGGVARLPCTQ